MKALKKDYGTTIRVSTYVGKVLKKQAKARGLTVDEVIQFILNRMGKV